MADNDDPPPSSVFDQVIKFINKLSFLEKILFVALIILTFVLFFLLSPKQITDLAANDRAGGNIQPPEWLQIWLNSGDKSLQRLNLQCETVPDENAAQRWTLECKNFPGGGDKNQTFFLQLEKSQKKSKQPSNETGNSLCCRPCNRTEEHPRPPQPIPIPIPIPTPTPDKGRSFIIRFIKLVKNIVEESFSELTTVVGIHIHKCQYQSETMSTQFEMELKKMLQKELLQQIKNTKETCKSKACLDTYPNALRYQFKNQFNDLLKTSLHQISLELEGSIDSAASVELITEHKQISSVEQASYVEVIEHHEQISVEQLHTEEVIKQEEIVVEESAEVIKHIRK